jgi:hypothetical protein
LCFLINVVAKQRLINLDAEIVETASEKKAMEQAAAAAVVAANEQASNSSGGIAMET